MVSTNDISPVKTSERFVILDALRGFALLGICMANFPEFSLYTFLSLEAVAAMPTAVADTITRYLLSAVYLCRRQVLYAVFPAVRHRLLHHHPQCGAERDERIPHLLPADGDAATLRLPAPDVHLERRHPDALCPVRNIASVVPPYIGQETAWVGIVLPYPADSRGWRMRNDLHEPRTPVHPFTRSLLCGIRHQRSQLCLLAARCGGLWHAMRRTMARYSSFLCKGLASGCRSSSLGTAISKS